MTDDEIAAAFDATDITPTTTGDDIDVGLFLKRKDK
jgi:hypothetical protein